MSVMDNGSKDKSCQQHYIQPLRSISKYFHFSKAAVIRTNSYCDEKTTLELLGKQNSGNSTGVPSIKDLVIRLDHLTEDITEIIYHIKVTGVDFIICLVDSMTVEVLFEMAANYELLDYSTIWLTIEQHNRLSHLKIKRLPWQWIDLRLSRNDLKWKSVFETMNAVASGNLTRYMVIIVQLLQLVVPKFQIASIFMSISPI